MRNVAALLALALLAPLAADGAALAESAAPVPDTLANGVAQGGWTPLIAPGAAQGHVLLPLQAAGLPPTIQDGIGPGSALKMGVDGIQFVCSASFLLRDPSTGTYYLSTAGHCLVRDNDDDTPVTGKTHPEKVFNRIDICVDGCINNGLGLGTYVSLRAAGDAHPVAFAVSGGIGLDFGLIEIPADLHGLLRPAMPQWGGPTGVAAGAGTGQSIAHYGHGTLLVPGVGAVVTRTPADQGRLGTLAIADASSFQALGHVTGGDSGSGASLATAAVPDVVRGTQALGVITHSVVYAGAPLMAGTLLSYGLERAQRAAGLGLELVPEGDPLPQGPTTAAPATLEFTAPDEGSAVAQGEAVQVEGTLSGPDGVPAGWRVQVAVDDQAFESGLAVTGSAQWNATWSADVPAGLHVLRARAIDEQGAVVAQANRTVRVVSFDSTGSATATTTPSASPGPGATSAQPASGSTTEASPGPAGDVQEGQRSPGLAWWMGAALLAGIAVRRRL